MRLFGLAVRTLPWLVAAAALAVARVHTAIHHALLVLSSGMTADRLRAYVAAWGARGQIQGFQTKNQLDPTEDQFYVPGNTRRLFEINGMKFGVVICHEGWRYPETVRWAAVRGAKIVFHPHHTGSDQRGVRLTQ